MCTYRLTIHGVLFLNEEDILGPLSAKGNDQLASALVDADAINKTIRSEKAERERRVGARLLLVSVLPSRSLIRKKPRFVLNGHNKSTDSDESSSQR